MSRIVAIDYGKKRIGLAYTDPTKTIASPYKTIQAQGNFKLTIDHLLREIQEKQPIEKFVMGLPLHMSGHESEMSQEVKKFGELLHQISGIEVLYMDERLSTAMVDKMMQEVGMNRKKRAQEKDHLSASILLESYLKLHC